MKISVKLTRAENTALLGAGPVELDLEEYLCGVVPSEIYESSHMEALKAQAVAARTFAVRRAMAGTVVDDTTSFQAYRAPLAESSPRSRQAVEETAGQVLTYGGEVIDCFYSASNGGTCKRSGEVWSRDYPYYVNKPDPWDTAARTENPPIPAMAWGFPKWAVCGPQNRVSLTTRYWPFITTAGMMLTLSGLKPPGNGWRKSQSFGRNAMPKRQESGCSWKT